MSEIQRVADAEAEILKVLWANGEPMTSRQIRERLSGESNWQRTTVQTLIKRLADKGVLIVEEQEGKGTFCYRPAISEAEFEASRTVEFLGKVFGGNPISLVSTLLNNDLLSEEDLDELNQYWQMRKGSK